MSSETITFTGLLAVSAVLTVLLQPSAAFHVYYKPLMSTEKRDAVPPTANEPTPVISRTKRYTEFQENALAICAGDCMYSFRMQYGDCYDLCNWNGLTPSPWTRYLRKHPNLSGSSSTSGKQPHQVLTHRFGKLRSSQRTPTGEKTATGVRRITLGSPRKSGRRGGGGRKADGRRKGRRKDCR